MIVLPADYLLGVLVILITIALRRRRSFVHFSAVRERNIPFEHIYR